MKGMSKNKIACSFQIRGVPKSAGVGCSSFATLIKTNGKENVRLKNIGNPYGCCVC